MKPIYLKKVKKEDIQSLVKTKDFLDEVIEMSMAKHKVTTKSMFGVSPDLPEFEREEEDFR